MGIPALEAVFSSPGLLEAPMQGILINVLRPNRTWNTTIINSPPLQQYLFFAPTTQLNHQLMNPKWTQTPLLTEKSPRLVQRHLAPMTRYFIDPKTSTDLQDAFPDSVKAIALGSISDGIPSLL